MNLLLLLGLGTLWFRRDTEASSSMTPTGIIRGPGYIDPWERL